MILIDSNVWLYACLADLHHHPPCRIWLEVLTPGERHWSILQHLLLQVDSAANLSNDAHLAALALEHDCSLCSADADFRRFPGLRLIHPLA